MQLRKHSIKKMVDNTYVPPIDYGSNSLDPDEHIRQIVREELAKLTAKQLGETYYHLLKETSMNTSESLKIFLGYFYIID